MARDAYGVVDEYIERLFAPPEETFARIEESIAKASMPKLSVTPNQGKLLHILALLANARRILEIGTLGGYSAVWMVRALPDEGGSSRSTATPRMPRLHARTSNVPRSLRRSSCASGKRSRSSPS